MLVLVADDDLETRTLVTAILGQAGFETVTAQDAMQTMSMAVQRQPAALILDIMMPAGTGLGALEKLKKSARTERIPVIVLSGITDRERIDRLLALGALEFLPKPVDPDALLAALRRALPERTA